jgi:diguanylate cyclase (GGDEF)-like protein/PAS domain S-box-containing protein
MHPILAIGARARPVLAPVLVLAAIVVLRRFDLAGGVPLWVFVIPLALGAVLRQLSGLVPGGRPALWISLDIITATVTMYLLGWGAPLAVAHLFILAVHLGQSGSRAWKPAALASAGTLLAGQVCVGLGLVGSYLAVQQSHALALLVALGTVTTAHTLGRSAARRERAESVARLGEERLQALVNSGSEVISTIDAHGDLTWVSPAALPVMGYRPEALHGQAMRALFHPEDEPAARQLLARLVAADSTGEHAAELRVRHADGTWHWHEIVGRSLLADPAVLAVVCRQRDITERRAVRDRIAYAAAHDGLTGLANAPTLTRDLERALAGGTRYQHPVALLFCDLDGFRAVNDTYGKDVGDRLLQAISSVIGRVTRDTDSAGRLGDDEFGVVLSRVTNTAEALRVARRIIDGIVGYASVAGLDLDVSCSVGVALAYPGGSDAKTLMRHADAAMDRARRRGRNGSQAYVEEEVTAPWS